MMQTGWAWRHTSVHLNYSDFTVAYNLSGRGGSPEELNKFLKSLVAMPSERPEEFQRLRKGVSQAAKWMRYTLKDCHGSRCDAFDVFKHVLAARARELAGKNTSKMPKNFVGPGTKSQCLNSTCSISCYYLGKYWGTILHWEDSAQWREKCKYSECQSCEECSSHLR